MLNKLREISLLRGMPFFLLGIIAAVFAQNKILDANVLIVFIIVHIAFWVYQLIIEKEFTWRWLNGLFIFVHAFCLGYGLTWAHTADNYPAHYSHYYQAEKKVLLQIKIDESPVQKKRSKKFVGQIISIDKQAFTGQILCYAEDSLGNTLTFGDELLLRVKPSALSKPLNPAQFDFAHFMRFRQIYHQIYFTENQLLSIEHNTPKYSIFYWSYKLRDYLSNLLREAVQDDKAFEVAASLLLGFREKLDSETIRAYSASGAMHVLAVSGLHVGIFYWILNHLLFFMNGTQKTRNYKILLLILVIWGYAFVTGLSPSIQRAALMFSLVGIAQNINRSSGIYDSIVVSAFALLCYNPYLLMEVGFQLSYSALLGIIAFHPIIYKQIFIENKYLDWIWNISCVSIAAQLATFPIGLLYFHQFPVYFMVSNLVVIPAATVLLPFGLAFFFISTLEQALAVNYFSYHMDFAIEKLFQLLNYLVFNIEQLPGSLLIGFSPTIFETWLCYLLIFSLLFLYYYRKKQLLYVSAACAILLALFYNFNTWENLNRKSITFYAIKNATAIDLNNKGAHYFIADSSLLQDKDQMLFSVIHNWWQKGYTENEAVLYLNRPKFESNSVLFQNAMLQVDDALVLVLDKHHPVENPKEIIQRAPIDLILLRNNPYFTLKHLKEFPEKTPLIIDGTNNYYFLKNFSAEADTLNLEVHYLMESGAFVYEL